MLQTDMEGGFCRAGDQSERMRLVCATNVLHRVNGQWIVAFKGQWNE